MKKKPLSEMLIDKLREKTSGPFLLQQLRSIWNILPDSKKRKKAETAASWRLKKIDLNTKQMETVKRAIQEQCFKSIDFEKGKLPAGAFIPVEILNTVIGIIEHAQDTNELMKEHIVFFEHFYQAVNKYRTSKEPRTEKKQAAFFRYMDMTETGITGRGKRPKKIEKQMLFRGYLQLVHTDSSRLEPKAALERLQKEFDLQSPGAVAQAIRSYLREYKKELEAEGQKVDPKEYNDWVKSFRIPRNP